MISSLLSKPTLLLDRSHSIARGLNCIWLARPGYNFAGQQWLDASGNYNHGTLTNGPVWNGTTRTGGTGELNLDGTDDRVAVGLGASPSAGAACLWFSPDVTINSSATQGLYSNGTPNNDTIITRWDDGTGQLYFYLKSGSFSGISSTTSTWTAGQWYHVVFAWDGSTMYLYVNGLLEASTSVGSPDSPSGNHFVGSSSNGTTVRYFNGRIDDFRQYDSALSASDIWNIYDDSFTGQYRFLKTVAPSFQIDTVAASGVTLQQRSAPRRVLTGVGRGIL